MLHGNFICRDKKGRKLITGSFKDNQKYGIWTIWDTLGCMRVKYKFSGNGAYNFKIKRFNNSEGKPIKRLSHADFLQQRFNDSVYRRNYLSRYKNSPFPQEAISLDSLDSFLKEENKKLDPLLVRTHYGYEAHTEVRDSANVISYPYFISGWNIFASIKMFRFIEPNPVNAIFFDKNVLEHTIGNYIKTSEKPEIYTDFPFKEKVLREEALNKLIDTKIAGYKIMEVWYFDVKRLCSDIRITGIIPVVFNETTQRYEDLFCVYYESLREHLSKIPSTIKGKPEVHTLEDIFHYRQFSSFVYYRESILAKEEDVDIYKTKQILKDKSISLEVLPLLIEYNCMLHFTEPNDREIRRVPDFRNKKSL
ncbi:hypothetical protein ACLI1A_17890 [Flavobacterium sp. RHBU_3]|uniref:hypothetical protein n=1 Tax=Flavobacterium sp. RHBU_3 TaxID=3391184 RepID=UPI003984F2E2